MNYLDYVIDLERVNELTNPNSRSPNPNSIYPNVSITNRILKNYLETYYRIQSNQLDSRANVDKFNHIVNTLRYNKILVSSSEIRESKINSVMEETGN